MKRRRGLTQNRSFRDSVIAPEWKLIEPHAPARELKALKKVTP